MFSDLREFIAFLEDRGQLRRVKARVTPILEVPEIIRRLAYSGGPAVLFENVEGYPGWRIAGNIFGTYQRVLWALGTNRPEEIGERLMALASAPPPLGFLDKLKGFREAMGMAKYMPRQVRNAPVKEVVLEGDKATFDVLPAFKTWPKDAGRYITYGLVFTRDPEKGVTNIGVYRIQLLGGKRALMHWQIHKRGAESSEKVRDGIDVAVVIGGDPATMISGVLPTPYPLDEILFAGMVRGRGVEVVRCESSDLYVPANAEVVVEGRAYPWKRMEEGPFGDHFGYYTPPAPYPMFEVETITMRRDPIYYGTVVGKPPLEDAWLGKAAERIFLPVLRFLMPEIVDMNLPPHGLFQGLAVVSIRKRYPGHAKKVMMGLWGLGQMALTKIIIVVDADVNVHDMDQVIYAVSSTVDPQRDVVVVPGTHADVLDHSTPWVGYGSKLGIDATRKLPEEMHGKEWPEEVEADPETVSLVDRRWSEYFP